MSGAEQRSAAAAVLALVAASVATVGWGVRSARADLRSLAAPGPLAKGHAEIEDKCDKCHVPFKGIPDSRCLDCHASTARRIDSGVGTHARWSEQGKKCVACHKDHKGREAPLSPDVDKPFDHRITGVILSGAHAQAKCADCHQRKTNTPRWVGVPRDCAGCHEDKHKGALGDRCAACHVDQGWKQISHGLARHAIDLGGGHEALGCAVCHRGGKHLTATSACGDCHQERHGGTSKVCQTCHRTDGWQFATFTHDFCTCILPGKHQTTACLNCHPAFKFKPTPMVCSGCHEKDRRHEDLGPCARCHSALSWKSTVFEHNAPSVKFHIDGRHEEVGCENCHTKRHQFRKAPKTCEGCHKVPAHGDFGDCAACHTTAGFDTPRFSHDGTRFPLDGKHQAVPCATCHGRFKQGAFEPGPAACAQCHQDPHGDQFRAPLGTLQGSTGSLGPKGGPELRAAPRTRDVVGPFLAAASGMPAGPPAPHSTSPRCADCHSTRGWKPSTVDVTAHARFRYPLRGAHATAPCAGCHDQGVFIGTPKDCGSCHVDRHRGRLGADCTRCHNETGWKDHPVFDHGAATGFVVEGAHAALACADCHGKDGARLASAGAVTCATCHTARHGEVFGKDCARCHQATRFEDARSFDHTSTSFPLERRHRAIRCVRCHDPSKGAKGSRPPVECRDCHDDPHGGRTSLACDECHRPDSWLLVRFDHDRAEFPLRGKHYLTPCRDCHTTDQWSGIRRECVSCHRGDRQFADQQVPTHKAFGWNCIDCHRPFRW